MIIINALLVDYQQYSLPLFRKSVQLHKKSEYNDYNSAEIFGNEILKMKLILIKVSLGCSSVVGAFLFGYPEILSEMFGGYDN